MIIFEHMGDKTSESLSIERSWLNYNKEPLTQFLAAVDWQIQSDTVKTTEINLS
jgi:hypothetical protein